jgi:hypothetical protein
MPDLVVLEATVQQVPNSWQPPPRQTNFVKLQVWPSLSWAAPDIRNRKYKYSTPTEKHSDQHKSYSIAYQYTYQEKPDNKVSVHKN